LTIGLLFVSDEAFMMATQRRSFVLLASMAMASVCTADASLVVRTEHFVAVGDVDAAQLAVAARAFEVLADSVHQLVPAVRAVYPRPVVILAFATRPSGIRPGFFARPPIAYAVAEDDVGEAGVEYVRELVGSSFENVPLWVAAGCGEYLRTQRIDSEASRVIVGAPVARNVVALRSRLLPLLTVLSATAESPAFTDANNRPRFVAQSWLLVHYLMTEPSRRGQLSTFLELLGRHLDPAAAFQQAFSETHETMAHRLSDYYGRMLFATRQLPLVTHALLDGEGWVPSLAAMTSDLRGSAATTASSPDADVLSRYRYGERLLNQQTPDADTATAVLAPLLDSFPHHPDLLALLGRADLVRHNPGAALRRFDEAFQLFPRYEYAILMARAEIAAGDQAAARALLDPLATRGRTEEVRQQAQALLRAMPPAPTSPTTSSRTVMPVFRQKKPGEQQESGTLTEIACSSQWVILHVRLRDRELRVASTRLDLIDFISYVRTSPPPAIICGVRSSPESVLITWRAEPTAPSGTEGIVEAVEFQPPAIDPDPV
jgi:hypothetical protein